MKLGLAVLLFFSFTQAFASSATYSDVSIAEAFNAFKSAGVRFRALKSELTEMEMNPEIHRSQNDIRREINEQRAIMFQALERLLSTENRLPGLKCDITAVLDKKNRNQLAITFSDAERDITFVYNRNAIQDFVVGHPRYEAKYESYLLFLGQFRQYAESIVFDSYGRVVLINLQYVGNDLRREGPVRVQTIHCGVDSFEDTDTP
jgi:hypothetical protein